MWLFISFTNLAWFIPTLSNTTQHNTTLCNTTTHNTTQQGEESVLEARGRHDPCVVPRAVPIVESMTSIVLADSALLQLSRQQSTQPPTQQQQQQSIPTCLKSSLSNDIQNLQSQLQKEIRLKHAAEQREEELKTRMVNVGMRGERGEIGEIGERGERRITGGCPIDFNLIIRTTIFASGMGLTSYLLLLLFNKQRWITLLFICTSKRKTRLNKGLSFKKKKKNRIEKEKKRGGEESETITIHSL